MMELTGEGLAVSALRYSLAIIGSGFVERVMRKLDTCIVNAIALVVVGVNRTARIPAPRAASGVMSIHNLYSQRFAVDLDRSPRAVSSSLRQRTFNRIGRTYRLDAWVAQPQILSCADEVGVAEWASCVLWTLILRLHG